MDCRLESGASLPPGCERGWTLVEIIIAIAVLAILSSIGVVMYRTSVHSSRVVKAIAEIRAIQMDIDNYYEMYGDYPLSLEDAGHGGRLDPWGNPYEFLNYDTDPKNKKARKDKSLKPLNSKYDLFSTGPDGEWKQSLSSKTSRDDIIRARDGEFVGIADLY